MSDKAWAAFEREMESLERAQAFREKREKDTRRNRVGPRRSQRAAEDAEAFPFPQPQPLPERRQRPGAGIGAMAGSMRPPPFPQPAPEQDWERERAQERRWAQGLDIPPEPERFERPLDRAARGIGEYVGDWVEEGMPLSGGYEPTPVGRRGERDEASVYGAPGRMVSTAPRYREPPPFPFAPDTDETQFQREAPQPLGSPPVDLPGRPGAAPPGADPQDERAAMLAFEAELARAGIATARARRDEPLPDPRARFFDGPLATDVELAPTEQAGATPKARDMRKAGGPESKNLQREAYRPIGGGPAVMDLVEGTTNPEFDPAIDEVEALRQERAADAPPPAWARDVEDLLSPEALRASVRDTDGFQRRLRERSGIENMRGLTDMGDFQTPVDGAYDGPDADLTPQSLRGAIGMSALEALDARANPRSLDALRAASGVNEPIRALGWADLPIEAGVETAYALGDIPSLPFSERARERWLNRIETGEGAVREYQRWANAAGDWLEQDPAIRDEQISGALSGAGDALSSDIDRRYQSRLGEDAGPLDRLTAASGTALSAVDSIWGGVAEMRGENEERSAVLLERAREAEAAGDLEGAAALRREFEAAAGLRGLDLAFGAAEFSPGLGIVPDVLRAGARGPRAPGGFADELLAPIGNTLDEVAGGIGSSRGRSVAAGAAAGVVGVDALEDVADGDPIRLGDASPRQVGIGALSGAVPFALRRNAGETIEGALQARRAGDGPSPIDVEAFPVEGPAEAVARPIGGEVGEDVLAGLGSRQQPARDFQAAIRDPETGQVYTGIDHVEAIESVADDAVRARLDAIYRAPTEDAASVGFLVNGQFMGREEGLAAMRASRRRPVAQGQQLNRRTDTVEPASPIDYDGSNRLQADQDWFEGLAGSRPIGSITDDPSGVPPQGLDTTPSVSDPVEMRMERARRMGFDTETPLYHGTNGDFQGFRDGEVYLSPNPNYASAYAQDDMAATNYARLMPEPTNAGPNVIPTVARMRQPLNHRERLTPAQLDAFDEYASQHGWQRGEFAAGFDRGYPPTGSNVLQVFSYNKAEQDAALRALGYDGRIYEDGTRVVFDPSNIRSRFAAFDPARSNSRDLLAGIGTGALAGAGIGASLNSEAQAEDGNPSDPLDGVILPVLGAGGGAALGAALLRGRGARGGQRAIGEALETGARGVDEFTPSSGAEQMPRAEALGGVGLSQSEIERLQRIAAAAEEMQRVIQGMNGTVGEARRIADDLGIDTARMRGPAPSAEEMAAIRSFQGARDVIDGEFSVPRLPEVTNNTIKGVVNRSRNRAQPSASASAASADEAAAQRLGMSVERYRQLSARNKSDPLASIALAGGAGATGFAAWDEAEAQDGDEMTAEGALDAYGQQQDYLTGRGFTVIPAQNVPGGAGSRVVDVDGDYLAVESGGRIFRVHRMRGFDEASNSETVYDVTVGEIVPVAPGARSSRPAPEQERAGGEDYASLLRPLASAGAGIAIGSRFRNPALGTMAAGTTAGAADLYFGGDEAEPYIAAAIAAGTRGLGGRVVDDIAAETVSRSPEFIARREAFLETLPNEPVTVRGSAAGPGYGRAIGQVETDREIMIPWEGPQRATITVPGEEIAEQGFSRELAGGQSPRERFMEMDPRDQLAIMDSMAAREADQAGRYAAYRQLRGFDTPEVQPLPPASVPDDSRAFPVGFFDPATGQPLYGDAPRPGRRPPPRAERRPFDQLSPAAQARRIGKAPDQIEAARDLGVGEFKTGASAMRALRERANADPSFMQQLVERYPSIAAIILGGGAVAAEMMDQGDPLGGIGANY